MEILLIVLVGSIVTAGGFYLISRSLVRKSLALTTQSNNPMLASLEIQLEEICRKISKCKYLVNVEKEGTRLSLQAEQLLAQYKGLKTILSSKLDPQEITYSRYLESIHAACFAIAESLIDSKNVLENLDSQTQKNEQWKLELQTLNTRLDSHQQALDGLAKLYQSINDINTTELNNEKITSTMEEVKKLADRAKLYSKN